MSIQIHSLSKSFGNEPVLDGFSTEIHENCVTCIMGPSGIGKTTLMRILMGLETQDAGTVTGVPELKSAVFQENRLFEDFGALENVLCVSPDLTGEEDIRRHFAQLGMEGDVLTKPVRFLSGGERRRVALLRAIFAESDILFLDEPFEGLDDDTRALAIRYVRTYAKGKTVILITHRREVAQTLADEWILM